MIALLLATLAASPNVASPSINLSGGTPSTASGIVDWSRSWSEAWPSGIPAPTISCVAAASNGDLTCTGATATKVGSPTTVTAAGYPERGAVALAGSPAYYNLGNVGGITTAGTFCVSFKPDNLTGDHGILAKDSGLPANASWTVYANGATLRFNVYSGSASSTTALATLALGTDAYACASYDGGLGDNQGIILGNVNGTASTPVTNARAPLNVGTVNFAIGAASVPTNYFIGKITAAYVWTGYAASAADLALLVSSQQARLASKPLNAAITVSSPATTVVGTSGALYNLPANSLAVTASGAEIWGAAQHSNTLLQSQTIATGTAVTSPWALGGGGSTQPTLDDEAAVAPDGTTTADKVDYASPNAAAYSIVSQPFTATAASWTLSVWVKAATGTPKFYLSLTPDGVAYSAADCAPTTTAWKRCSVTGTATAATWYAQMGCDGRHATQASCGGGSVYVWGAKAEVGSVAGPYVPTTSAPVSGTADAVSVATTLTNPAKWCVGVRATPPNLTGYHAYANLGTWAGANSAAIYSNNGDLLLGVYDGTGAFKKTTATSALVGATEKTLVGCVNGGALSVYSGGALLPSTASDVGTGIFGTSPTTLWIGHTHETATSTNYLNGQVKKVCQGPDFKSVNRCLGVP